MPATRLVPILNTLWLIYSFVLVLLNAWQKPPAKLEKEGEETFEEAATHPATTNQQTDTPDAATAAVQFAVKAATGAFQQHATHIARRTGRTYGTTG